LLIIKGLLKILSGTHQVNDFRACQPFLPTLSLGATLVYLFSNKTSFFLVFKKKQKYFNHIFSYYERSVNDDL
jgi:hypothetical protein